MFFVFYGIWVEDSEPSLRTGMVRCKGFMAGFCCVREKAVRSSMSQAERTISVSDAGGIFIPAGKEGIVFEEFMSALKSPSSSEKAISSLMTLESSRRASFFECNVFCESRSMRMMDSSVSEVIVSISFLICLYSSIESSNLFLIMNLQMFIFCKGNKVYCIEVYRNSNKIVGKGDRNMTLGELLSYLFLIGIIFMVFIGFWGSR